MKYLMEKFVFAPFGGQALSTALKVTDRSLVSLSGSERLKDDLDHVRGSADQGSFIVLALAKGVQGRGELVGSLPVSIDGHTGVLRTRLVGDSGFDRVSRRTHIGCNLVSTALNHLLAADPITHVRVEAPFNLQYTYLAHGLAIGATTELAIVAPIQRSEHSAS